MGWTAIAMAALQGVGAISQYSQEKKAAKETRRANEAAMQAAEEESRLLKEDAKIAATKERALALATRSQQSAMFLKSGVTFDGSPMLVMQDTTDRGDENARNTISNAESRSRSMMLRARATQQPVKRADLFGTLAKVGQSANAGYTAGVEGGYWN
jgi:hypothetical protein